jgi:hypothetical protein
VYAHPARIGQHPGVADYSEYDGFRWLPAEFRGARSFDEVIADLRVIAAARHPYQWTLVKLRVGDGPPVAMAQGPLTFIGEDSAPDATMPGYLFSVGDRRREPYEWMQFSVSRERFTSASLHTLDGADYYGLGIKMGEALIVLSDDPYNTLDLPEQSGDR